MNSSVHCWKNEGPPSCVGARERLDSHRQNGFFVALSYLRFDGESRPASRRYPLSGTMPRAVELTIQIQ